MSLTQELSLRQSHKLVMTEHLKQSLNILQMTSQELKDFLEAELQENPVIEMEENSEEEYASLEGSSDSFDSVIEIQDEEQYGFTGMTPSGSDGAKPEPEYVTWTPSLTDYLMEQLRLSFSEDYQLEIGEAIIGNINDDGYLECDVQELSETTGFEAETVEAVLRAVQKFEPPGIAARDIIECILLQIEASDLPFDIKEVCRKITLEHLDDIAKFRITKIADALKADLSVIQTAVDAIRSFDPKPGRSLSAENIARCIVPDICVRKIGEEYIVTVRDSTTPKLVLNPFYKEMIRRKNELDEEIAHYVRSKFDSALRLIKCIELRRNTLQRIGECIIDLQKDFFENGNAWLHPMTLKSVADVIGLHESTVSRAVAGKYIETPRGTYELKYFFKSGVSTAGGDGVSSESVKSRISDLIRTENKNKPLSDDEIAKIVRSAGIIISRRTIAKYREELKILPSTLRRRRDGEK